MIEITGPDAEKFLQGQFTVNIKTLEPNIPRLAAYCNLKGRVIAVFFIKKIDNNKFIIDLPGDNIENFLKNLKKYAVFSKIEIIESKEISCVKIMNFPVIYQTTSEKFLPHMLNLPELGAIDFNKGCYLGQEIIARTEYRGKVKRKMQQVKVSNKSQDFTPGNEIFLDDGNKAIVVNQIEEGFLVIF